MDKKRKERIIWFIDFINTDLDEIKVRDQAKWLAEIGCQIHQFSEDDLRNPSNPTKGEEAITEIGERLLLKHKTIDLQSCQKRLKDFFEFMMVGIDRTINNQSDAWKPSEEVDFYPSLTAFSSAVNVKLSVGDSHFQKKMEFEEEKEKPYYRCVPGTMEKATIEITFEAESAEDTLLFTFAHDLEGFPLRTFRKCSECENWYVHFAKRERLFCSNLCASRNGARRRREKIKQMNPEKYGKDLKASADRARKSYVNKVQEKLPNAKIERRLTKH